MEKIMKKSEQIKDWLINIRRDFHQYPELGMQEFRTSKKICKYLEKMNISYNNNVVNTGVVGLIQGKYDGPTIALRADIDALPIQDGKKVLYKSKNDGVMHACGHDAHTAILLGAGKVLNEMKDQIHGNIKLLFQPAEETVGGAKPMIEEGVLKNPEVDAVFGLHVDADLDTGKIGIKYNQMNAASNTIEIHIYGKSTHGAYPHEGADSILIASHVVVALQSIVSRNVAPTDASVVTIGKIIGGTQENIIADHVVLVGTVRNINEATRKEVMKRIEDIVKIIPKALGGRGELIQTEGYRTLVNDDRMVDIVVNSVKNILGEDKLHFIEEISLGVEDFAYFAAEKPSAFFRLGCKNLEKGIEGKHHHPCFDIDEDCLTIGVAMQVSNVLEALQYFRK
ncbi:M20 metallopeptidase family protein [Crassaminicella indica]|uniref:Amidohydrolase n=1 Tax=Crassaminicella indica TaxID=2855394 RepID=A0ABX8RC10_9CLOT|nr:amidohydrolase [Crassaminicella indica]QXM06600.1 amidohydrolase [Crassaminicella indica]